MSERTPAPAGRAVADPDRFDEPDDLRDDLHDDLDDELDDDVVDDEDLEDDLEPLDPRVVPAAATTDPDDVDVAVLAYLEDDEWVVEELDDDVLVDLDTLLDEVADASEEDDPAIALLSIDEDVLLIVRVDGDDVRLAVSDTTAAEEWPLVRAALRRSGVPEPSPDDESVPGGDTDLLADLGIDAVELTALLDGLLDDDELLPEDVLVEIADALGFGDELEELTGEDEGGDEDGQA